MVNCPRYHKHAAWVNGDPWQVKTATRAHAPPALMAARTTLSSSTTYVMCKLLPAVARVAGNPIQSVKQRVAWRAAQTSSAAAAVAPTSAYASNT